jgi:sugar phosphate isomerase/epimerase
MLPLEQMNALNRRQFFRQISTVAALSGAALTNISTAQHSSSTRKMTMCLVCGAIGVSASQTEAINLAHQFGFESVEAHSEFLAKLSDSEIEVLLAEMTQKKLVFGAAGLPVDFRRDDVRFRDSVASLQRLATGIQRAGVSRWGTWLTPGSNSLTYIQNFKLHARRLREAAIILKEHGQRLGLEYVGTKTSRQRLRYPFIHSMAELKELISEIGTGNVGCILDTWHWWQADETPADILTLKNDDVIAVDLNDAPAGVDKDKQMDMQRELPMATGVIDTAAFLSALNQIGYDGPVRAEPFNKTLNGMGKQDAVAATASAMRKAFALIE